MTIEIITAHEADQIARMKKPLTWPLYSTFPHCSGPRQQGRTLCMTPEACQTGQHKEDEYATKPPMTRADAVCAVLLVIGSWAAVMLLIRTFT